MSGILAANVSGAANETKAVTTRAWWVKLLLITGLALVLRLAAVTANSFWYDEAVTAWLTDSSYAELYGGTSRDNGNPPLYWILARAWSGWFGRSEVGFRSMSVVAGTLAVFLLGILGRRLVGETAGLWGGVLLALSPLALELSNEARSYAVLHVFVLLSTLFFVRWVQDGKTYLLLVYAFTLSLSWYSHYYAFLLVGIHGLALLVQKPSRRILQAWLAAVALAAFLWLPWAPAFLDQLRTPGNLSRMGSSWQLQFAATPVAFPLGRTLAWRGSTTWILAAVTGMAVIAFWLPLLIGLARLRQHRFVAACLGAWCAFPVLIPLVVAVLFSPLYHVRYGSLALPAFVLLVAAGITALGRPLRTATLLVALGLTGASLFGYFSRPLKPDWRPATRVILENLGARELIVFDTEIEVTSLKYYGSQTGRMPPTMIGLTEPPGPNHRMMGLRFDRGVRVDASAREQEAEILSAPGIWLVLCEPYAAFETYRTLFAGQGYDVSSSHQFHRIGVYHFVRPNRAEAALDPGAFRQ